MQNCFKKEEKKQVIDLQEQMRVESLKLATLKSSARLNMWQRIEDRYEALNSVKENGTTETSEELDKLHGIWEYKEVDVV